ncbi:MAG: TonB-dependent receptor [Bacteroidales bacterium]|nr:TonB-dependent receptor [Bacteroidales bacterium]
MKLKPGFLLVLFFLLAVAGMAQSKGKGIVKGRVVDAKSGEPVEFASVALLHVKDSSMATGDVTSSNGSFSVAANYGSYIVRVTFMGYNAYFHPGSVNLSAKNATVSLGKIELRPSAMMMEEVTITAERSMVEYQLDKRVINVDKNIVTGGGTATDVLENVPSVAIDNDGNVTLRGSSNVKVLINGRPYELLGSDLETLLEQIPASTVENVEVITNPSAKYDPEGMSGIINLKLKEKTAGALGLNGIVNANIGAPLPFMVPDGLPRLIPTGMGSLNLNYTTEKYNLFFNLDGGMRSRANKGNSEIERRRNGLAYSHEKLTQLNSNQHYMLSGKFGGEYYFDSQTSLLLSYQMRYGDHRRTSAITSEDLFNSNDSLSYDQSDTNTNDHINHAVNLSFVKKFSRPEQQLNVDATYSIRTGGGNGWQEQRYTMFPNAQWDNYYLRETESDNTNHRANLQVNYVHPFSETVRLETGYEGRIVSSDQDYRYYMSTYDNAHTLNSHVLDNQSSTHYVYSQQIHALYATLGTKLLDRLSAQAGLRGEYSNVAGNDENHPTTQRVDKTYWQLYPTLHLSYEINKDQSLQVSYSRRVRRPRMWDLNPYLNIREGQELSFGNPGLDPEFTNAYEVSYNLGIDKVNIFTSAYFRQTNNRMTRYGFVWDAASAAYYSPWMAYNAEYDGYWASTWQNLNKELNYGMEFIVDYQATAWWKLNASVNLFQSYIEGSSLLGGDDRSAFRASGKLSSFMTLPHGWTIQLSGQYRAPFMDLQTDMYASYWADLAVKKDVLQKRGTINLRIGDVFCTGGFGHKTNTDQLYRTFRMRRISPTITLGFSYKINNGLRQKPRNNESDDDEGGDE